MNSQCVRRLASGDGVHRDDAWACQGENARAPFLMLVHAARGLRTLGSILILCPTVPTYTCSVRVPDGMDTLKRVLGRIFASVTS
eukprot:2738247-Prymnesium_polylepis.1